MSAVHWLQSCRVSLVLAGNSDGRGDLELATEKGGIIKTVLALVN